MVGLSKIIDFAFDWIIKPILMSAVVRLLNKAKWGLKSTLGAGRYASNYYKFRSNYPKYKLKYR